MDWNNIPKTITNCARVAQAKGYVYFAVQFWGECWASRNGSLTYDKHGKATTCHQGVGEGYTNFVYMNTGVGKLAKGQFTYKLNIQRVRNENIKKNRNSEK